MPLRRGDGLTEDVPRPRLLPLAVALLVLVAAVAYVVPLTTTGDPLWPLPTDTHADAVLVYSGGTTTEILPADQRYKPLMDALNAALRDIGGIEYTYGLRPDDVIAMRAHGQAVEARYDRETHVHGGYAVGPFRRILVPLAGPEADRGLIFFGDESGYRAGPLRTRSLGALQAVARSITG